MTTTAVQPIEKFCSEKLIMCEYVNDLGYCRLTACARQLTPMTINEAIDFLNKSKWTLAPHALGEAKWNEAVDIAVKALSSKAVEIVRCKECKHQDHCHETVAHTRKHDEFIEHWSESIEWCSRGEYKGGDDK